MSYGIKYLPLRMKLRKELQTADDTALKVMKEEIKREQERRNKNR